MCVINAAGKVLWQGKCASTPEVMVATVKRHALQAARIAIETGPMSAWHYHSLAAAGLPVVCVDARHAKAALAMQLNKTDANDAVGLAQIVRTGCYREVAVKSERSHRTRGLLAARAKLVGMRKEVANQLRGLLKVFGHVIGAVAIGTCRMVHALVCRLCFAQPTANASATLCALHLNGDTTGQATEAWQRARPHREPASCRKAPPQWLMPQAGRLP